MASKFQSRLVGTIILAAAGVIVLPDILDGEKKHYKEEFAAIPIKPALKTDMETFEVLEPVEVQTALPESPVAVTEPEASEPTRDTVNVSVQPVAEKNQYQDSAWIIQLMALKNAENAKTLVGDLQKRGYQAHRKKEGEFTRVIVGPDTSKEKLEKQIKELKEITGSQGQLMKFRPLNP
ncbi:cell division protein DedD [Vibrio albus]|uniref:Cell division protein DedD n=1 Tax=Vibrio albus TaxID=2200953 RepID=A0A2U3BE63_9VIBR|nr:SPOR domain-containing protein [Vibrio albus]PWI35065.1 cell division protein DedD [Vibrio albus]